MVIASLDRKLLRDLWLMKGQVIAISMVIASGVALYVMMLSTFDSLTMTQQTYYDRFRFGDIFASLKRAPMRLEPRIAAIPGVAAAQTRVLIEVTLDVEGLAEPARGRLISIPAEHRPKLCDVFLRTGRWIEPDRPDEVLVSEGFALAHHLEPGDTVGAIINGTRRQLEIVGVALSPEYVYTIPSGEMVPDDQRFAVFWMERRAVATAFQMEGGFNNVVLTLMHGVEPDEVIARLDDLLRPYGGLGAFPRKLQESHRYLQNEMDTLHKFGSMIPIIFLVVAGFLLNVVLSRIVNVQREQIAAIKALGYSNTTVALHYLKMGVLVAVAGWAIGVLLGAWFGLKMTMMYADFFRFPILRYALPPAVVVQGAAVSLAAAALGVAASVRRAVKLPPAEAMRPEPPARFRETAIERAGLARWLSQPARIILRTLARHPGRAALSVLGIAAGGGLLVLGNFMSDSVTEMIMHQFTGAQRFDMMISFTEPVSPRAFDEIIRLPAVLAAEPFRAVPVRLKNGHLSRQTAITGLGTSARLNRVVDSSYRQIPIQPDGLVLSATLADLLGVAPGDTLTVEVLEGRRPIVDIGVSALVDDYMGTNAFAEIGTVRRLMGEADTLSGAYLQVDGSGAESLYTRLKNTPRVAGVARSDAAIESFEATFAELVGSAQAVALLFATIIAFGVVYNSARISLAERSRELATLRVMGFTRAEISYILLGELALLTMIAVPLGLVMGYVMSMAIVVNMDTELFRMPLVITNKTMASSAITITIATVFSALVVRRKLDRLDLVEVLKTRE